MANLITDISQVKDAAHIPDTNDKWDGVLTDWIAVAGDAFQKRYRVLLNPTDVTETYFDISSGQLLALKHVPVNSIASIITYDTDDGLSSSPVALIPNTDFRLQDSESGLVKFMKLGSFIPVGLMEAMSITPTIWAKVIFAYNTGLTTVPALLQRGAAELIAHWFDQYGTNQELKADGIGDIKSEFFDYTKWPETVKEMFASYDMSADKLIGII